MWWPVKWRPWSIVTLSRSALSSSVYLVGPEDAVMVPLKEEYHSPYSLSITAQSGSIWNSLTFQLPSMDVYIFHSSKVWPSKVDWMLLQRFSSEYLLHPDYYLFMPQRDLGTLQRAALPTALIRTPEKRPPCTAMRFSHLSHLLERRQTTQLWD